MGATPNVVTDTIERSCGADESPCPRDLGEGTAIQWTVTGGAQAKPDFERLKIAGTTIETWDSGIGWWTAGVMPVTLLTDPQFTFRPFAGRRDHAAPATDFEDVFDCKADSCGFQAPGETADNIPHEQWFWKDSGTYDVTITAQQKKSDGTIVDLCTITKTYQVKPPDPDALDRRAVDYYVNGISPDDPARPESPGPGEKAPTLHARWHASRDLQKYFMGEDWLVFHRLLTKSFDDWRAFFGYPPVTPYDGSTPVPTSDGGLTMNDATRPETASGTFVPDCYKNGTGCAPPPWFTAAGDGQSARTDDLLEGKCYYASGPMGTFDEVPVGQMKLGDFRDVRGLGCVLNRTHHGRMHQSVPGAFAPLATTPRDPLFWAYHKWASGVGDTSTTAVPRRDTVTITPPLSVLAAWEHEKATGPPGVTAVFPPRGLPVAALPGVAVFFWEPVTGVAAADLTVGGFAATTVAGSGAGPYVFSGYPAPAAPPPGGTATLDVVFAPGAIRDVDGNPFAGDAWQTPLESDQDGDYVPDSQDDCPTVPNPDQTNTDALIGANNGFHGDVHDYGNGLGDSLGDACDPDDDGDGIPDTVELANGTNPLDWQDPYPCPLDPAKKTSGPGLCGCGVRDVDLGNGQVACFFETSTCTAVGQACDDGDPCTTDACAEPDGCVGTPLPAYDGLACRVGVLGAKTPCGADPLQRKLAALLAKQAKSGHALAEKAGRATKAAKRQKLLHRVDVLLGGLMTKVDAAVAKGKLAATCGGTIDGEIGAARALLPPLLNP